MSVERLNYFNEIIDKNNIGNIIYSCDMLRLKFVCNKLDFNNYMNSLCFNNVNYKYYQSLAYFKYRHIWIIDMGISTITIGYSLNSGKSKFNGEYGFVEFNPNKCIIDKDKFFQFYNTLAYCFKYVEIVSYDIAIDLPVARSRACLQRFGKKTYITISKDYANNDLTEYLGKIHNKGTTKLYNKTIEQKLVYELTRYEFTFDSFKVEELQETMPNILIDKHYNKFDITGLSSTERVLLNYLLNDKYFNMNFNLLSRAMKKKLKPYIEDSKIIFTPNFKIIMQILTNMRDIFEKDIYVKK